MKLIIDAIVLIIERKRVARHEPLIATSMEVYREIGLNPEYFAIAEALDKAGIVAGKTFAHTYYKLKK